MPVVELVSAEVSTTDPSVVLVEVTAVEDRESADPFTLALRAMGEIADDAGLVWTLTAQDLAFGEVDTKPPVLDGMRAEISSVNNPSGGPANDLAIIYLVFDEDIVSESLALDSAAVRTYFGLMSAPPPMGSGLSPFIERADLIGNEAFLTLDLGTSEADLVDSTFNDNIIIEVLEPTSGTQAYIQDLNGNSILDTSRSTEPLDVRFGVVRGITGTYDTAADPSVVLYTVTFTEPVGDVGTDDFAVVDGRGTVRDVSAGSAANVYIVTVEPSANLEDPIVLEFATGASLDNALGDPIAFLGDLPFNAVYVDNRAPMFMGASNITALTGSRRRAVLTLEFDEPIDPLSVEKEDDFEFSHDGFVTVLQTSAVGNEVRVTLEAVEGGGEETVTFSFTGAAAFQDRYGNPTAGLGPLDPGQFFGGCYAARF